MYHKITYPKSISNNILISMDIFLWTLIATVWDANGSRDFI